MNPERFALLATPVSSVDMRTAVQTVREWIEQRARGRTVCFSTVHMIIEGRKDEKFRRVLDSMDLNCPDGVPLVWAARLIGKKNTARVCGPDFMPTFCRATADMNLRHFFYGGAPGIAQKVADTLQQITPELQVAGVYSPPFGDIDAALDEQIIDTINRSKPDVVWVCLGCPKQELWLQAHKTRLNAKVLLAVGLAFDIVAGEKKRAPKLLQATGLEWTFRLMQEPRRLWKRYLILNGLFLMYILREALQNCVPASAVRPVPPQSALRQRRETHR